MRGQVLGYSAEDDSGLISGKDGNRYSFTKLDWKASEAPAGNMKVDFEIDGTKATDVLLLGNLKSPSEARSKTAAILFAFFLGAFGAHKFYLGQTKWGIVYLLFFWTAIPALIAFVEFIILLLMNREKFDERFNS